MEIGDPDFFWNTGYKFHGEAIESSQADALVLFYQKNGDRQTVLRKRTTSWTGWLMKSSLKDNRSVIAVNRFRFA